MLRQNISRFINIVKEYSLIEALRLYFFYTFFRKTKYIRYIKKNLSKEFSHIIKDYQAKAKTVNSGKYEKTVWVLWWQGDDNAPNLVKMCINSIKNNLPEGYRFVLLNKDNYNKYTNIPYYIIEKFKSGKISITHFSDLIRQDLLCNRGGIWLDSTIFAVKKLPNDVFENNSFWSIKIPTSNLSKRSYGQTISTGKYCGFALASKTDSVLMNFTKDCNQYYWKNHNFLFEYFIQILIMSIAYDNIPAARQEIDKIKENNINIYELQKIMNDTFSQKTYDNLVKNTTLFKLSRKKSYIKKLDNETTTYGHLCK